MPNYRRAKIPDGTYFLTQVTHHPQPWLTTDISREALRTAIAHVRQKYPFTMAKEILGALDSGRKRFCPPLRLYSLQSRSASIMFYSPGLAIF